MIEVLQSKNSATKLQILVEIAAAGPGVHQRRIAHSLGITPQAVSDYVQQLQKEGLLLVANHSSYRVTAEGVNWILKALREVSEFVAAANRAVTNIAVCAAIAESDLVEGQAVGLKMKDGVLFATAMQVGGAKGVALSAAGQGDDVDIGSVQGLIDLPRGTVVVLEVPAIQRGGSKQSDLRELQRYVGRYSRKHTGAVGIEALVALRKIGFEPPYFYGVAEAAIEATRCGLPFLVVSSEDALPGFVKRMRDEKVDYQVVDMSSRTA